ncbi:MAG TPA: 16S rRNA (guanine(527)-N(7))-methyltransferase RsmG [Caulobacteraceae bacterium]|jgi:16S rRNA (guanine527-N7)-methyltransferase|nr:16S rRNA (guanine(527)-N(7))-methyltransferase RsmG [Caulobacteraceae bacterium]
MSDAAARLEAEFLSRFDAAHLADVEQFRLMLARANERMNLVGASTLGDFQRRHFLDSAQLLDLAPKARKWADLGSGAGLPGLILAILLKGEAGARVHLVESTTKKCRFLSEVAAELALPAEVHNARAELLRLSVEVVTARACAPLTRLLGYAKPYLDRGAKGLFLKGEEVDTEIREARESWRFAVQIHPSLSDERGRIVEVSELQRGG